MSSDDIAPAPDEPTVSLPSEPKVATGVEAQAIRSRALGRLAGKVALISGGDHGIGRAVAVAFAAEGADVAILYRDDHEAAQETMHRVVDSGCETMGIAGDVGVSAFCDDAIAEIVKRFGRIDVLVNAASEPALEHHDFRQLSDGQIERTFRTNILGQFFLARAALPHLREGGVVLNTSSAIAFDGHASLIDDAASQGAVIAFTRSLARHLAPDGVRVNAVAPGASFRPEAVAPSYVFLASGDATCMSGQIIHPTGGTSAAA